MKKKLILGTLLPLMCLASCKGEAFAYEQLDLTKDYILYRSMDAEYESDVTGDTYYKTKLVFTTIENVIEAVEWGEDVMLLFYGEDCGPCQEVIPSLVKDIAYLKLTIYVINENTSMSASTLNRYITENHIKKITSTVINGGTPSLYLLNNKKITEVFYGSKGEKTTDIVFNALKEYTTCCGLIYGSADLGRIGDSNIPTYILDKRNPGSTGYYYQNVFPLAKRSSKRFQVLDVSRVEKDSIKNTILEHFGINRSVTQNWSLESFDGWIVYEQSYNAGNGAVGIRLGRMHYTDTTTSDWLIDYFKN